MHISRPGAPARAMRVAVVGVGRWGANHVRALAELRAEGLVSEILAIDKDGERLKWAERVYGARPLRGIECAQDLDVDAAIIATPTSLHFAHAALFLSRGIPTLVEKPFTATLDDTYRLLDIAGKTLVTTGYLLRFHQGVRYSRDALAGVGGALAALARRTSSGRERGVDAGVIKDLAIHDADLVTYITGARAECVRAQAIAPGGQREEHAQILADYGSLIAAFEASWLVLYTDRRLEIVGGSGTLTVDFVRERVCLHARGESRELAVGAADPLLAQDREFLMAAAGRGGEVVSREDIVYTMRFCEAATLSARAKKAVCLDEL